MLFTGTNIIKVHTEWCPGMAKNHFLSFGLPFTLMILGSLYVLTEIRSARYSVRAQEARAQRRTRRPLNALEEDIEAMEEQTRVVDEYEMLPVSTGLPS